MNADIHLKMKVQLSEQETIGKIWNEWIKK